MIQHLRSYLSQLKERLHSFLWLFVSLLALLTLNNLVVQGLLSGDTRYLSLESLPLLWNTLWMTTLLYVIPILIPHRIVRRAFIIIELVLLCAMHIEDLYLVSTYQMPYCDAIATPIFATNASEAQGFFKSMNLDLPFMLWECSKMLLAIFLPWGIYRLICFIKRSEALAAPMGERAKHYTRLLLTILLLVGTHYLGIRYLRHTRKATRAHIVQYNQHAPLARLLLSAYTLQRQISACNIHYTPRQATPQELSADSILPPHDIVLVVAEEIYPHLMHCYNPIVNENTPTIDSLIQTGSIIKLDSVYSASDNAALAAAWTLSLSAKGNPDSWDAYPSLYSLFRAAGYDTYWLDNTARLAPGLDVYPQLAADCDAHFFTHLRVDEEQWADSIPYDDAILNHLKKANDTPLLTTIHLMGGRSNIWWRIPDDFYRYNRLSAAIDIPLPGDQLDGLAQYYNVVYYQDYLLGEIIRHYQDIPALIIFCSPQGVYSDWHPYSSDEVAPQTRGQVPLLLYLSPAMQLLHPSLLSLLRQLNKHRHDLSNLPQLLTSICGIRVSLVEEQPLS